MALDVSEIISPRIGLAVITTFDRPSCSLALDWPASQLERFSNVDQARRAFPCPRTGARPTKRRSIDTYSDLTLCCELVSEEREGCVEGGVSDEQRQEAAKAGQAGEQAVDDRGGTGELFRALW